MSQIPSLPGRHLPDPNVDENESGNISTCVANPIAAYENKPNPKSTASDVFTPLKSVVGGLSAVLQYYDVRYPYFIKP